MSLSLIREVFHNLSTYDSWSLQLLQIKNSKRNGTSYCGREITLSPSDALAKFLVEISSSYCSEEKGINKKIENVSDYDGSTIENTIYKLSTENELIANEYSLFVEAIANPDTEVDPLEFKAQAYILKGIIRINDDEKSVKLISMQNPVTSLKHKFLRANGTFKEISDKVISLRTTIDVVIVDNLVYMLTLAGENLFNMERAYKSVCASKLEIISEANIVNDPGLFSSIAGCGHNPRKFISYNDVHMEKLKNIDSRKRMSEKFNIPLVGDKFDVTQEGAAEKLIKLLCDRGMVDPFDDNPMEVSNSKKWK